MSKTPDYIKKASSAYEKRQKEAGIKRYTVRIPKVKERELKEFVKQLNSLTS